MAQATPWGVDRFGRAEFASDLAEIELSLNLAEGFEILLQSGSRSFRLGSEDAGLYDGLVCAEIRDASFHEKMPLAERSLFQRGEIKIRFDPPFVRIFDRERELFLFRPPLLPKIRPIVLSWRNATVKPIRPRATSRDLERDVSERGNAPGMPEAEMSEGRLNNFVRVLAQDVDLASNIGPPLPFKLGKESWVHVQCLEPIAEITVVIRHEKGTDVSTVTWNTAAESARGQLFYLPEGRYLLSIKSFRTTSSPVHVIVKSVPELLFARSDGPPWDVSPIRWIDTLKGEVLTAFGTIVVGGIEDAETVRVLGADPSRRMLLLSVGVPGGWPSLWSPPRMAEKWDSLLANSQVQAQGIIADELVIGAPSTWQTAFDAAAHLPIGGDGHSRRAYFYVAGGFDLHRSNLEAARAYLRERPSDAFVWESYLGEPFPDEDPERIIRELLVRRLSRFQQNAPEMTKNVIVLLGITNRWPMNLDTNADIDFRVWLDMQVFALATASELEGFRGVGVWATQYSDERIVRWIGELARHYGLEGKRDLLSTERGMRLRPQHIKTGNFSAGAGGWTIVEGSAADVLVEASFDSNAALGAFPRSPLLGNGLRLIHARDSRISLRQKIGGLERGRTYSVRLVMEHPAKQYWGRDGEVAIAVGDTVIPDAKRWQRPTTTERNGFGTTVVELSGRFRANSPESWLTLQSTQHVTWSPTLIQIQVEPDS